MVISPEMIGLISLITLAVYCYYIRPWNLYLTRQYWQTHWEG